MTLPERPRASARYCMHSSRYRGPAIDAGAIGFGPRDGHHRGTPDVAVRIRPRQVHQLSLRRPRAELLQFAPPRSAGPCDAASSSAPSRTREASGCFIRLERLDDGAADVRRRVSQAGRDVGDSSRRQAAERRNRGLTPCRLAGERDERTASLPRPWRSSFASRVASAATAASTTSASPSAAAIH